MKMHPEGPKMRSKLPMGLPKRSWGHQMEPRGSQRRPQRKPKEVLGGPRWTPERQDVLQGKPGCPQRAPRGPQRRPRGATWPPRWAKRAQRGAQKTNKLRKRVARCKKKNVDFSLCFSTKMRSWRVWLGSFWAHVEIMWCHCGHLGQTWSTWRAILDD